MITTSRQPDPARFFTTDPRDGALLDDNGDGVPDGLRVRLHILGQPTTDEWLALLDLAARLGLETGGLTLPIAAASPATLPANSTALVFMASGCAEPVPAAARWAVRGAAEIRALSRAGINGIDAGGQAHSPAMAEPPPAPPFDLAQLYEIGGALADDADGLCPDRIRLCPVIPPNLPPTVGLALLDLAARLGLETTGLRFPLAVPAAASVPADCLALTFALTPADDVKPPRAPGEGRCVFVSGRGGGQELRISGDEAGAAKVLHELAATWPALHTWEATAPTVGDLAAGITAALLSETAVGRAAILAADLDRLAQADTVGALAGELRLLLDEAEVAAKASAAIDRAGATLTVTTAPDDRVAFVEEWTAEWEVDRARRAVRERVLPLLDPASAAEIAVLVSEPRALRRALGAELATLPLPPGSTIQVLSAFKPGLCWLLEVVAPRWMGRDDVARIEVHFRPFSPPEGARFLDLPIRPLQELYPGDEVLAAALGLPREAVTMIEEPPLPTTYRAIAFGSVGQTIDVIAFSPRSYAREYIAGYPEAGSVTVATGAITAIQGGHTVFDERLPTDLDLIWDHYQGAILPKIRAVIEAETGGAIVPEDQPFFEALEIDAWVSETDEPLGLREELLSAAEALHQDFYFGTLDAIAALGTAAPAPGTLDAGRGGGALDAPGAIRPFVHLRPSAGPRLRVALRRRLRHLAQLIPADGSPPRLLGQLPTGARPCVVVGWLQATSGVAGLGALGLEVLDADAGAAAIVRALASDEPDPGALDVEVRVGAETIALTIPTAPAIEPATPGVSAPLALPDTALETVGLQPFLAQLAALPGVGVREIGRSFEGRPLAAIELTTPQTGAIWSRLKATLHKPTLLIIARHHANEPASTHAALELAARYATDPACRVIRDRVNIALLPLENPDGAALHALMRREHPTWKHHAARYNAVGREFARDYHDAATPWGEARARPRLWREWLPDAIMDNHGVPSHEWNQHFNGFGSPPRFGVSYWLVSALLYGIAHYPTADPAHAAFAEAARDRIARAVADDAEIVAANGTLRAIYERWGHDRLPARFPASYHREMLWYFGPQSAEAPARAHRPAGYDRITVAEIVTEVPDETARGDYLALVALAHLVANEALLALLADLASPVGRSVVNTSGGPWLRLHRQRPLHPTEAP